MLTEQRKLWIHKIQVNGVSINNYGKVDNTPWYDNCNEIDRSEEAYKNINITLHHFAIRNKEDYEKKTQQLSVLQQILNIQIKQPHINNTTNNTTIGNQLFVIFSKSINIKSSLYL